MILKRKINTLPLTALFLILLLAPVIYLSLKHPVNSEAAWFNDQFAYRNAVPITSHSAAENNVYINVTIDTSAAGQFKANCGDLRFTTQDGKLLKYYIVSGCGGASTAIHVFFDQFPAGAQTIYYYYGNSFAPDGFQAADFATEATSYVVGSVAAQEKSPAPIAYWKFDENGGTTVNDTSTTLARGSLPGGSASPAWVDSSQCVSGSCLKFDGSQTYLTSANTNIPNAGNNASITISAWIKQTNATGTQDIFTKGASGSCFNYGLVISSGVLYARNTGADYSLSGNISLNSWTFVTIVYTSGGAQGYVNGVAVGSDVSATTAVCSDNNWAIGTRAYNSHASEFFNGYVDDLKIYNYARSADQIKLDYNSHGSIKGASTDYGASTNPVLSNGLVGYWKMDEATWSGTLNEVTDSSGNGNHGTAQGTTGGKAYTTIGKFGNSGFFDGIDDYVDAGEGNNKFDGLSELSMCFWMKTSTANRKGIIGKGNSAYIFVGTSRDSYFYIYNSSNQLFSLLASGGRGYILTDGSWHHYCYTANQTNMSMYIDGALNNQNTITGFGVTKDEAFSLKYGTANGYNLDGNLDEIRFYNRALSPSEIQQVYNFAPGPVGYWKMDEKSGANANDSSGNSVTGSLASSVLWASGKYGGATSFPTGSNSYINVTNNLYKFNYNQDFTVSAWVYKAATSPGGWFPAVFAQQAVSAGNFSYAIQEDGSNNICGNVSRFGIASYGTCSAISLDTWTYVAMTYTSNTVTLYINGSKINTATYPGTVVSGPDSSAYIGNDPAALASRGWNGQIDEVKVYNYARTAQQVVEDMNAGHPAPGSPVGSPIGYWKFDEGYGQIANNSGSQGSVDSGTLGSTTGSDANDPTWVNQGKFSRALQFTSGEYVNVGNDTSLNPTSAITISAWIKLNQLGANQQIVVKDAFPGNRNYALYINTSNKVVLFIPQDNAAATFINATSNTTLTTGVWYHVVGVFSASNYTNIYINGSLDKSYTSSIPNQITSNTNNVGIGDRVSGTSQTLTGLIDEVKIFNSALTADQVRLDFNKGQSEVLGAFSDTSGLAGGSVASNSASALYCVPGDTNSCNPPTGEWKFEEGQGQTANDTSGNNNPGTLGTTSSPDSSDPTFSPGKIGKSLLFNGSSDFVSTANSVMTSVGPTSVFTIQAWVYNNTTQTGAGDRRAAVAKIVSLNDFEVLIGMPYSGTNKLSLEVGKAGVASQQSDSTFTPLLNTWYLITGIFRNGSADLYVNGQYQSSVTYNGTVNSATATNAVLSFGAESYNAAYSYYFNGKVDQVRFYDYARTPAQVAWDYNQSKPTDWWKFDECQGISINDAMGNLAAGTWNGTGGGTQTAAGTCSTAGTAWGNGAIGKYNSSLNFDGSDDYVDLGSSGSLPTGTRPRTISLWYKMSSNAAQRSLFSYGDNLSNQRTDVFFINGSPAQLGIEITGASVLFNWTYDTNWHHFAAVFPSGSTTLGSYKLYLDGVLQTNTSNPVNVLASTNTFPKIGCLSGASPCVGSPNFFYSGQLDDIKVFSYDLTPAQIKQLYNQGAAVRYGPLTGTP